MATDTTNIQSETVNSTVAHEGDVERTTLTQGATQVQLPQGEPVVRIQVTPGETIQLPFPQDQMTARLDDGNGNLAVKVGDITVILQGYVAALGEGDVNLIDVNGEEVDIAAVVAATDPNLDIETAAGPGAGDQGTGVDNNGGVFSPFDPRAGIGGLNAIGGLDPTALDYPLIQREFLVFEVDEEAAAIALPEVVSITPGIILNEDDFGRGSTYGEEPNPEVQAARASFNISNDDMPPGGYSILDRLSENGMENAWCGSFGTHKEGNDPFDVDNYDPFDGKFNGVDSSKEPLSSTAIIEVNFQGSFPGTLTFDGNGDGIDTGDAPVLTQLAAMGLTSHGHQLAYMLIPAVPESFPGANDGTGQMIVAYYLDQACNCYSEYEGEGSDLVPVIVFTVSIGDDAANGNELNQNGNNDIPVTYSIYGVIDHAGEGEGEAGEDILSLPIPFYVTNGGGTTEVPSGLGFHNVDDVPSLGEVKYGWCGDEPVAIYTANLTIGHDESKGTQDTGYDSDLQPTKGDDQHTDDVGGEYGGYLINKADDILDGIAQGYESGEDVDISYQQGILAQLSEQFLNNGNFCAEPLGVAKTYLTVSFGADGKAKGNDQAGETLFRHDNDKGQGTDSSQKTYDSQGNLLADDADPSNDDDGGTDKRAFELFMSTDGKASGLLDKTPTNWEISFVQDGVVVKLTVYAFQLDANTIIGMASPTGFAGEGGGGNGYPPVENGDSKLQGAEGNGYGGMDGEGDGIPVFMLRLDPQTGQLVFVQYHQIDNALGGDADKPDWNDSANDPIHLYDAEGNALVYFQATDFDGDTVTAQLEVSVIDDAPKARDDYADVDEGTETVTGNLITGISYDGNGSNNVGKDTLSVDAGHKIVSMKHDGVTYTLVLDAAGNPTGEVEIDGGPLDGTTTNLVDGKLTIEPTDLGGKLVVQMTETGADPLGHYEYTSPSSVAHGDPIFKGFDPKADNSNDSYNEWKSAFSGLNIEQSGTPGNGFDPGNDLGFKTVTVPGEGPNGADLVYRGIGVKHGIDSAETDRPDGALRIGFADDQWRASLTLGALFDGVHFDNGHQESVKWEIWDGNTKVGEGIIYGDRDGLVTLDINEGIRFDRIELIPQDNGAGNNGNNSDFLLINVTTTKCDDDKTEKFDYLLQDADGDQSDATLHVNVEDLGPKAGYGVTCDSSTVVKERALDDGQDKGPDGGTTPWSDAEIAEGQIQGFDLGPDAAGAAINIQLIDANDSDNNSNNGTVINDIGDLRSKGQKLELTSDGGLPATISAHREGDGKLVFTLTIQADGSYKFQLFDQLDHPDKGEGNSQTDANDVINLKFEYTIVDGDACAPGTRDSQNDVAKGTITITVQDDGPEVQCITATCGTPEFLGYLLLDEDHLQHGNKDQNGKFGDFDGPGGVVATGQIVTNLGADQAASFKFTTVDNSYLQDALGNFVRTSDDGSKIKLDVQQNGTYIVATEDGSNTPVFTIKLNQDGSFEFKLYEAMAHDDTVLSNENLLDILLHFGVRVTDFDGDWVDTVLKFAIDDDQPFFTGNSVTKTVEEEALSNYNSQTGKGSDGNQEWNDGGPNVSQTSGSLSSLVSIGADTPGKWEFNGGVNSLNQQDLSSKGVDLTYSINGDTLTASAGGRPVFTLKIEQDGDFTFKLYDQIDHPADGNTESSLPIDFSKLLKFTDGDGDTIVMKDNGKLVINVVDDKPVLTNKEVWAVVEEEQLSGGNNEPGDNTNTKTANGSLSSLVKVGADENASFSFVSDVVTQMGAKGLTSGGVPLFFALVGDTLIATKGNGGDQIFTLKIETDGDYVFELKGPLDHGPDGNTESWLSIDFSNVVKASDQDHDFVVLGSNDFRIKIVDDVPVKGQQLQWTVDEDSSNYNNDGSTDKALPGAIQGDGQGGANGDSNGGNPDYIGFANKPLGISFGADGPAANPYQFSESFIARDQDGAPLALKSGGQDVTLVWAGNVLTGWAGGVEVFTLTIDQSNGTASFQLKGPLDHPDNNGSEYEDTISVEFAFTAEDKDGDKVSHSVKIFVNDDSPDACCMETPLTIEEPVGNGDTKGGTTTQEITITPSTYDGNNPGAVTISVGIYDLDKSWGGKGWVYKDDFDQGDEGSKLFDSNDDSTGFGVDSNADGGSGGRYDEVNYLDDGGSNDHKSEYISFKLSDADQTASKVELTLNYFYPNEQMEEAGKGKGNDGKADEVGAYKLYKDGVAVSDWIEFTADNASGNYTLTVDPGVEFDEIRMIAKRGDGNDQNGNEKGDSSDYYVSGATFTVAGEGPQNPTPTVVSGTICANYGADGPGGVVMLAGNPTGLQFGGKDIVESVDQNGNLQGKADGVLVYEVVLDVDANTFDFKLYRPIDGNADHNLDFNYVVTDNDGDSDTGCIKITVEGGNEVPTLSATSGIVDEDFLSKDTNGVAGNKDLPASDLHDGGGSASATGTYTVDFKGEGGTVAFNVTDGADTGVDTHDGTDIVWDRVSDTQLVGHAAGDTSDQYFTMSLNTGTGEWTFTLLQAIKHAENSNEDAVDPVVNVGVIATDNNGGDTATSTISVTIDDDMPVVAGESVALDENTSTGGKANVMFILDVTGSMNTVDSGNTQSRLVLAKAAIIAAAQKYFEAAGSNDGNIKFQLVTFGASGVVHGNTWMDYDTFVEKVEDAWTISNTNYDRGLLTGMDGFNMPGAIPDAANVSFFVSDGEPNQGTNSDGFSEDGPSNSTGSNSDNGIGENEEAAWKGFLEANDILSYAIGIGPNATTGNALQELGPIAHDGRPGGTLTDNDLVLSAADVADLETVLGDIGDITESGNLLDNDTPGADGWADQAITQVVFGQETGLPDANGVIVIETDAGTLTVYGKDYNGHSAGDYTFEAGNVDADTPLSFTYTAVDSDGDGVEGTLSVTVKNANLAPVAVDDGVINGSENDDLLISIATLLGNDSDPDGDSLTLISVQNGANGTATIEGGNIRFVPTSGYTGPASFQYTIQDPSGLTAAATVSISIVADNTPPEGKNDNIITSNSGDVTVLDAWLLRNDTDAQTPNDLKITGVEAGTNQGSFFDELDHSNGSKSVSFNLDQGNEKGEIGNGDSTNFNYTVEDPQGASDAANVSVKYVDSSTLNGTNGDDIIIGDNSSETLNGGKGDDILVGGSGNDTLNGGDGDDWLIYDGNDIFDGGSGFDTLKFLSAVDVDVDNEGGNFIGRVNNIEAIDMRNGSTSDDLGNSGESGEGGEGNGLSASDVIDMTDGGNTLYILGDGTGAESASDEVRLQGDWTQGGVVVANDPSNSVIHGLTFTTWTSGSATIYVQNTIDVDNNV